MIVREVELLSEACVKDYLEKLIAALDELDEDDYFGVRGWRDYIMGER